MKEKGRVGVSMVQFHHGAIKRKTRKRPVQKSSIIFEREIAFKGGEYLSTSKYHPFPSCLHCKKCKWWPLPWTPAFTFLNDRTSHSLCKYFEQNLAERRNQLNGLHASSLKRTLTAPEKKQPSWGVRCPPTLQRDTNAQFCTPPQEIKQSGNYPVAS